MKDNWVKEKAYAKVLVGEHKGKTLWVNEVLENDKIIISVRYNIHEYKKGEYEFVNIYG